MLAGFALICGIAVALLLYAEANNRPRLRAAAKLTAATAFIGLAVANGANGSTDGLLILAGLMLCAAGDALLLSSRSGLFLAGMGAFAAGHAFFLAAFAVGGLQFDAWVYGAGAIALAGVGGYFMLLRPKLGAFLPAVAFYCAIISAMMIASFAHFASGAPEGGLRALAAAGFALSDVSVARDRFVRAGFANKAWGLPLYFGSQCLFAFSV
jgi:uncharacterized membrane protein YhhN